MTVGVPRDGRAVGRSAPTLLAVAHGTADQDGLAQVHALVERVRRSRPGLRVELCYLDVLGPSLTDTLAAQTGEVVVVPLLLGPGYHTRVDIPTAVAEATRTTGVRARVAPPLGPHPLLAQALADRLVEAGWRRQPVRAGVMNASVGRTPASPRPGESGQATEVVLAAAGSRDPDAWRATTTMAQLLRARLGVAVTPAFVHNPAHRLTDVVAAAGRVAVAAYLLASGFFWRRTAEAGGVLTSPPLGDHPAVVRLILRRYDEARTA